MRTAKAMFTSLTWVLLGTAAFGASSGGALAGVVVNDKSAPLANALFVYTSVQRTFTGPNGQRITSGPVVGGSITTATDGTFIVSGLPAAAEAWLLVIDVGYIPAEKGETT